LHPELKHAAHRPWPLPSGPWVMAQTWHDLLFAHWPVETGALRRLIPRDLPLDTFEGRCWVGIAPFHMSHIHARGLPPLPGPSRFPELNVRTYVTLRRDPPSAMAIARCRGRDRSQQHGLSRRDHSSAIPSLAPFCT